MNKEQKLLDLFKKKVNTLQMSVSEPLFSEITKHKDIRDLLKDLQDIAVKLRFCQDIKLFNNIA